MSWCVALRSVREPDRLGSVVVAEKREARPCSKLLEAAGLLTGRLRGRRWCGLGSALALTGASAMSRALRAAEQAATFRPEI